MSSCSPRIKGYQFGQNHTPQNAVTRFRFDLNPGYEHDSLGKPANPSSPVNMKKCKSYFSQNDQRKKVMSVAMEHKSLSDITSMESYIEISPEVSGKISDKDHILIEAAGPDTFIRHDSNISNS